MTKKELYQSAAALLKQEPLWANAHWFYQELLMCRLEGICDCGSDWYTAESAIRMLKEQREWKEEEERQK